MPDTFIPESASQSAIATTADQPQPFVREDNGTVSLHFDLSATQSSMRLVAPDHLDLGYTRTMMGCLLFNEQPRHVVLIGLGGGSLAKYCYRHWPQAHITVLEINPQVIALRDAFAVPPDDERFRIVCGDGAQLIRELSEPADWLMVDGFDADGQAPSLCTQRFYDDCQAALAESGVLVVNFWGNDPHVGAYLSRLQRSFADDVVLIRSEDAANQVAFAGNDQVTRRADAQLFAAATRLEQGPALGLRNTAQLLTVSRRQLQMEGAEAAATDLAKGPLAHE
ncbi:polyamine aminopropyltransferase [Silvimonas sp.]|uniref:spermine/spermidine synthase domain-containing protein n=1 Tax=Silvimonas sp. TaxID=2650811 RepID=UPI00284EB59B|nr:polyamine aminopropyltransferase [Silvimonas sp.]MDR3429206.1 polyamine aminopropyltransferase [Silvimonas sp.]